MPETRLLLVDAANVMYRAFFAIAKLSTKAGRPTNAVFGFIRMLRQWERLWKPTHWAVVFDGGLSKERLGLLESYKANRPPMPDDLRVQFETIEEYLDGARVARRRMDGVEADDLIASIAAQAESWCDETLIVTSDKDFFQLVTERRGIVLPSKPDEKFGAAEVEQKTGVPPARIVEWLALTGDAVDNVRGVPGLGPKTAARLLKDCGSIHELLEDPARVQSERHREALMATRDVIRRNIELIKLRADIPVPLTSDDMVVRGPDAARLLPFFERMEFHSMADALRTPSLF